MEEDEECVIRNLFHSTDSTCCGDNCYQLFEEEKLRNLYLNVKGLSTESKRSYISGCITTTRPKRVSQSVRILTQYRIQNVPVCRKLFSITYDISFTALHRLSNVSESLSSDNFSHFGENRGGCPQTRKIKSEMAEKVVKFLHKLRSDFGLPDPGRYQYATTLGKTVHLPHCMNVSKIYDMYLETLDLEIEKPVSFKSFRTIWDDAVPDLKILSSRSDMCGTCFKLKNLLSFYMAGGKINECTMNIDSNQCTLSTADSVINALAVHREKAHKAREFYRKCQTKAKTSFENRSVRNGKQHVEFLMISIDFAQSTDVPNYSDQVGQLYFLSPLSIGIFGISDEGANQHATYLMPENRSFKKNGNTVASLVMDFLKKRNCTFDNLMVFADNTSSQNKNRYFLSSLSLFGVKKLYGCKSVRLCFLVVGHTKFRPDSWFGLLKKCLRHKEIHSILDIEEAVLESGSKISNCVFAGFQVSHVPFFTHDPFTGEPLVECYDFTEFIRDYCKPLSGHSLWYDIKFSNDGTVQWRNSPCGDEEPKDGHYWITDVLIQKPENIQELDINTFPKAVEDSIDEERIQYLTEKVMPLISRGKKLYERYANKGEVKYRQLLCPLNYQSDQSADEMEDVIEEFCSPTIVKSSVKGMSRKRLIGELVMRKDFESIEELADSKAYPILRLRELLLRHAAPEKKHKKN